jgi:Protein of unknown function (DUF2795)
VRTDRGAQFPASRVDLRRQAEQKMPTRTSWLFIDALPDGPFDTIEAVVVAIDEATEPAAGEQL